MTDTNRFQTPMMRQYVALKEEHPDAILLFRCGDFYETYDKDAEDAGRLLNISVTRKGAGADGDVAMAGVPYHAIDTYLAKLVRLGRRVAIAEQTEDPKKAKGLVKREIVRVVSPGTAMEEAMLEDGANNYLVCLLPDSKGWGISTTDLSTGFFAISELNIDEAKDNLLTELVRFEAKEVLLPKDAEIDELVPLLAERQIAITRLPESDFQEENALHQLLDHFQVQSLEGFGAHEMHLAIRAAGALLQYLKDTQKTAIRHIRNLRVHSPGDGMVLDAVTQRSLELVKNIHGGTREGTLFQVLDQTSTPMGTRKLRSWILNPLRSNDKILERLEAVAEIKNSRQVRMPILEQLKGIRDLERVVGRASLGTAGPKDLGVLRDSLEKLPEIKQTLQGAKSSLLQSLGMSIDTNHELSVLLSQALSEHPPTRMSDGGMIAEGFDEKLDEIRYLARSSKDWIAEFRAREAKRIGLEKLKIGYNKVFGYYIEVSHAQQRQMGDKKLPEDYVRKQTLANGERYITQELKEKEDIILNAEDRMLTLEQEIFTGLREAVSQVSETLLSDADLLAQVDCLCSLSQVAASGRYVRPEMTEDGALNVIDGRHPVLEAIQRDPPFVANDVMLGGEESPRLALITGPNMAGKSTYIRQVALITLLAHIGSFVPASEATVPIVDRIFTRVGAMDHLARGQSTFLVEMTETANILRNTTSRSLVILDEIGRGTSTYDGLSIAWSVVEYLHNTPAKMPIVLFATHYHELTQLESALERVKNFHVAVLEHKERITFLYKILPGATDQSYGVHAAQFAGVPEEVVERARKILGLLEKGEAVAPQSNSEVTEGDLFEVKAKNKASILPKAEPWEPKQLSLFDQSLPSPVEERLKEVDPNRLTPMEALAFLAELRNMMEDEE